MTLDHWWVEDRRSAYYNDMRRGSQGGFLLRTTGYNSSERLATMGTQYDYAAVIDFNRPDPVIGRGAGIFLHAFGTGATGGLRLDPPRPDGAALRWLNPAAHPRIVIGEDDWLARPRAVTPSRSSDPVSSRARDVGAQRGRGPDDVGRGRHDASPTTAITTTENAGLVRLATQPTTR